MGSDTGERRGALLSRKTVLEARRYFGDVVERVSTQKERVTLTRHGTDVAAIVPMEDLLAIVIGDGRATGKQLAEYALGRFSHAILSKEQAESWGIEMGEAFARSCRGAVAEQNFIEAWRELAGSPIAAADLTRPEAGDPCLKFGPYALMQLLRRERQLVIDSQTQSLRLSFPTIIASNLKIWNRAIVLVSELGARLEEKGRRLIIGRSQYHEERVLARLACDLFVAVHGISGLQIEPARWSLSRELDHVYRPYKVTGSADNVTGDADIRVANRDAQKDFPEEALRDETHGTEAVIFRHIGYRAYANGAWLAKLTSARYAARGERVD
jgi:prevent-host-death family protein